MKIVLITSELIAEFPPIITMIEVFKELNVELTCITLSNENKIDQIGCSKHLYVKDKRIDLLEKHSKPRLLASICFRLDNFIKKRRVKKIPSMFSKEIEQADIVWISHERTMLFGGKSFVKKLPPYFYTMYELPLKAKKTKKVYSFAAQQAKTVIVPEYCRAHIIKAIYSLDHTPKIVPNKSLFHPREKNQHISDKKIESILNSIKQSGKRIIMYMGIISKERPLAPIIEIIHKSDKYEFVVLGARTRYLSELESKYKGWFHYLGSVEPPYHLNVASYADIAYVCYIPLGGSVNAVFCAPNKVYEFAGFGIPLLCNDVPGLKFEVEVNNFGVCVPEISQENLFSAIDYIEENYYTMSENAQKYFEKMDIIECYKTIISDN